MILAKIAWRNLFLHRRKSLAALLSIAMAFVSLSLFEGYIHDVHTLYDITFTKRQMLGHVIIEGAGISHPGKSSVDADSLSGEQMEWIEAYLKSHPVKVRVRFLNITGMIASAKPRDIFVGLAYDVEEGARMRAPEFAWNTYAGLPLDQAGGDRTLLVGKNLAALLGCDDGGREVKGALGYEAVNRPFTCAEGAMQLQVNTESAQSNAMDFQAVGLITTGFADLDSHIIMMPLTSAQRLYNTRRVSYVSVLLSSEGDAASWTEGFNAAAQKDGIAVHGVNWKEHSHFGDLFRRSMQFLEVFRDFVIAIILVVVTMAIMNTFVRIVHERVSEIGTLRSIGYRPAHVVGIFAWEACFLALYGSILGVGLALAVGAACNAMGIEYDAGFLSEGVPFRIELLAADFLWITLLVMGLTLLSTLFASWSMSRRNLAELIADH